MTIAELQDMLEYALTQGLTENTEVRLAMQPAWPMQYTIRYEFAISDPDGHKEEIDAAYESLCDNQEVRFGIAPFAELDNELQAQILTEETGIDIVYDARENTFVQSFEHNDTRVLYLLEEGQEGYAPGGIFDNVQY